MSYKALYRTYRPQKFSEVVGQKVIVKTLQNALINKKTSHAYLFSGPRGTGKTTVARLFAKALNCAEAPTNEPCLVCKSCKEVLAGSHPDVIEIDAASNNGVDQIREIRDKVKYLPSGGKYRVYIIDEVHMLSSGAFNALLKVLEEPPKHVVFILATTEPHKVLPTILSRCQCFDFKPLSVNEIGEKIKEVTKEEKFIITDEAVIAIGESAEGGLRDALSYLDQAIALADEEITIDVINDVTGNLSYDKIIEICEYCESKQTEEALKAISELVNMGKEISKVVISLVSFYRDALLFKTFDTSKSPKYIFKKENFQKLASEITEDKIYYYVDILNDVQSKIKYSLTPQVFLEIGIIKMINVGSGDLDFVKRINLIETKIENIPEFQDGAQANDDGKLKHLEMNFAKITSELSKLELYKLSDKVTFLEKKILNGTDESNNDFSDNIKKLEKEILSLKEATKSTNNSYMEGRLAIIEEKLNEINKENHVIVKEPHVESGYDYSKINEKIEAISKQIENVKADNFQVINERISTLEKASFSDEVEKKIKELVQPIYELLNKKDEDKNNLVIEVDESFEVLELKEKIANIEEKLYRLISGTLATIPAPIKKTKKEVHSGQVFLAGDEVMHVAELDKVKKEDFNFEDIQKQSTKEEPIDEVFEVEDEKEFDKQEESIKPQEQTSNIKEDGDEQIAEINAKIDDEENLIEDIEDEEIMVEENPEESKDINAKLNEEILKMFNQPITGKTEDKEKTDNVIKEVDEDMVIFESENEKVVKKRNSEVVIRTKSKDALEGSNNLLQDHELIKAEESIKKEINIVEVEQKNVVMGPKIDEEAKAKKEQLKEYASYSSSVILRIMNDALSIEAKNDKARIIKLWSSLHDAVSSNDLQIANLLSRGKVSAVGKNEFIIVYDDAVICNQVMAEDFKKRSLKVLYDILGDEYNYMALPEKDFSEKRSEYAGYYQMGTKPKSLTPVINPDLRIIGKTNEHNPREEMLNMAKAEFGDDIVKVEGK